MSARIVAALIAAPLFGGLVYLFVVGAQGMSMSVGPRQEDLLPTFMGAAIIALVFEIVVLLPAYLVLRRRPRFRLNLILVGVVAWFALSVGGLLLLGQPSLSAAVTGAQLLVLGVPLVGVFVALIGSGQHA
jgi:hypothetical protein